MITKIVFSGLVAFALSFPFPTFSQSSPPLKGDPAKGKAKFVQLCAACHGAGGKGDGPAAAGLNPKPKDLTTTKRPDAEIAKVIGDGGPAIGLSAIMPAWKGALSEQDIVNVTAFIRSLCNP